MKITNTRLHSYTKVALFLKIKNPKNKNNNKDTLSLTKEKSPF